MIKIEDLLPHVANTVVRNYHRTKDLGVLSGKMGIALFLFNYAEYSGDVNYKEIAIKILIDSVEQLNDGYSLPTYCSGIAGMCWGIEHLNSKNLIDIDIDELVSPLDSYFHEEMKKEIVNENYDFLHGALGYGFYFLNRIKHTKKHQLSILYLNHIEELIFDLNELAIREDNFIKWESVLDRKTGQKGFNLSFSHGISSVIYFLHSALSFTNNKSLVLELLDGSTNYLLSLQADDFSKISKFPSWVNPNEEVAYNSRIAWCYGDIGIGLALTYAGKSLNRSHLKKVGLDVLLHVAKRYKHNDSLVVDSGFCHGSFGNAYIFNCLNKKYKKTVFQESMEFWLEDGLQRYTGNKHMPFKQFDWIQGEYVQNISLLEGLSGIGLVMIDFLSDSENTWDECLMLR